MASTWIRTRPSARDGVRFNVLYRDGGRESPIRSAGTFSTASEAENVRQSLALALAGAAARPQPNGSTSKVYIAALGGLFKIGISTDPERRCRDLNAELLHTEDGGLSRERELHRRFSHLRVQGEWFAAGRGEIRRYIRVSATRSVAA